MNLRLNVNNLKPITDYVFIAPVKLDFDLYDLSKKPYFIVNNLAVPLSVKTELFTDSVEAQSAKVFLLEPPRADSGIVEVTSGGKPIGEISARVHSGGKPSSEVFSSSKASPDSLDETIVGSYVSCAASACNCKQAAAALQMLKARFEKDFAKASAGKQAYSAAFDKNVFPWYHSPP